MRKITGRLLAFGAALCLLVLAGAAAAEGIHTEVASDTLQVEVLPGYEGRITFGKPIPIRITVRNSGEDLEGTVAVNTYVSNEKYDRYEMGIFVPAGGERTVVLPVEISVQQNLLTVEILRDGEVVCAVNRVPEGIINPSAIMIGVLSTRPKNLANLDINQENDVLNRYEYWQTVPLTPETLPEDAELLDAFGMMVLDDVDPAALTEKQQNALKEWVRRGRILICGGGSTAPRNLAFLGGMTSLRAEDFTVSDRVHDALESFAGRKASGTHPETALAVITGGEPLVSDERGNGLIWRVSAGAGRIYQLAWEAGDQTLNAESLMHFFYQQMLLRSDLNLYNTVQNVQYGSNSIYPPGDGAPVSVRNMLPVAAGIIAGAALVGAALWFILNRRGASKWMWAGLPVLALVSAAAVTLLAGTSMMNRPVAAVAVSVTQDADGKVVRHTGITAAAPRPGLHSYTLEGERLEAQLNDSESYYWTDETDDTPKVPVKLRSVITAGEHGGVALNASDPWESVMLMSRRTEEETGRVEAEIWMESDGLHGWVRNGTDKALREGAVVCIYGYARIPALKPGESAEFTMKEEQLKNPGEPVFRDGVMYRNAIAGMYEVVRQLCFGDKKEEDYNSRESQLMGMINTAASQLQENRSGTRENYMFLYCAEPEDSWAPAMYADGEKVESRSELSLLTVEMNYSPVGKTGVVFITPGLIPAVRCELSGNGMPAGDMIMDGKDSYYMTYHTLNELPTFRFTLKDLDRTGVSRMTVGMEEWYLTGLKAYVLNVKQKTWVEFTPNAEIPMPAQYIDEDGNLYVQFRPENGESYMDIPAPTLTLEGRAEIAEP